MAPESLGQHFGSLTVGGKTAEDGALAPGRDTSKGRSEKLRPLLIAFGVLKQS